MSRDTSMKVNILQDVDTSNKFTEREFIAQVS